MSTAPSAAPTHTLPVRTELLDPGPAWRRAEADLTAAGLHLPLFGRAAWASRTPTSRHRLLIVRDANAHPLGAAALQIDPSSALPGHHFLRVLRFGEGLPASAWEPTIAALARLATDDKRALRLSIGVHSRQHRTELAALLQQHGFARSESPQSYRHTLLTDLTPDEPALLAGLHKSARKNLREFDASGLHLATLTDGRYAARLDELQGEAMRRSGGRFTVTSGEAMLSLSAQHPELSHLAGLFPSPSETTPENLLGFAWGCMHGGFAEYRAAGTTRVPGRRVSVSYPLLWDLLLWAKRNGATWFDMGGVTVADPSAPDALAGISDFKRYFSRELLEVGEEWTLVPHPARARAAAFLGQAARRLRSFLAAKSKPAPGPVSPGETPNDKPVDPLAVKAAEPAPEPTHAA